MKIINSVGGRTTLACVLHILSVSLCGSRCMLSAQAQKKCFIYTELIVWLWWNAQTLQSIWHNVCPPPIYISFVACIRMHILSHVIVFFSSPIIQATNILAMISITIRFSCKILYYLFRYRTVPFGLFFHLDKKQFNFSAFCFACFFFTHIQSHCVPCE